MNGELPSLPEDLNALTDATHERFLTGVRILMLLQVLRQSEPLLTMFADMSLFVRVLHYVPLQRILGREELLAVAEVAFMPFELFHFIIYL
jgi:hypothetical protein